jgi:hypothetical protein
MITGTEREERGPYSVVLVELPDGPRTTALPRLAEPARNEVPGRRQSEDF